MTLNTLSARHGYATFNSKPASSWRHYPDRPDRRRSGSQQVRPIATGWAPEIDRWVNEGGALRERG